MKLTFIETPVFTELVTDLLDEKDYRLMQEHLLNQPVAGDLIVGTGGCRKLRWCLSGRKGGKSGGIRVIYYFRNMANQIIFLLAYDHRSIDDLTPDQKRQLSSIARKLK
jgi:mRNA-degrading endonuclease RelE of RelBE toxin-antitoxin system